MIRDTLLLGLLQKFQTGYVGRVAIACEETLDEDTDKRLQRKGFLVAGKRETASLVVIYGPVVMYISEKNSTLACISFATIGMAPLTVSQIYLFNIISELKDHPPIDAAVELLALQRMLTDDDAVTEGHGDGSSVTVDLRLPTGEHIVSRICMHCAQEFLAGRSDGAEFMTPEWTKTLLAYLVANTLSNAAEARNEETMIVVPGTKTHH